MILEMDVCPAHNEITNIALSHQFIQVKMGCRVPKQNRHYPSCLPMPIDRTPTEQGSGYLEFSSFIVDFELVCGFRLRAIRSHPGAYSDRCARKQAAAMRCDC
jgi:hypothetical protein